MRARILVPPGYVSHSKQIRLVSDGTERSTPRFLHAFADKSKSSASHPDKFTGGHSGLCRRAESFLLFRLVGAGLVHDDARRKHARQSLVFVEDIRHEARRLRVCEVRLTVPALVVRHKRTLERKRLDFI